MDVNDKTLARTLLVSTSFLAMTVMGFVANAQSTDQGENVANEPTDEIVVTGIRASLKESMDVKRNAQGIVDAITSEDIGKFPDTNLAESLQRITGVSIDRSLGEGSTVTVRGFGADFNLVTLNGRQMPTSTLGDGASAPSSRSFDFGNLASEAISSVEVYKTSKANIASGGIGATLNIKTTKPLEAPGQSGTIGIKGVWDNSQLGDSDITPEISGLYSNTFMNDRLGFAVSGSYQHRKGGVAQANVGWRDGLLGNQPGWGQLPAADQWNWFEGQGSNRPGDTDVYEVPQNADYELADFERKRINGQAVLQYDFADNVRGTFDYTYSANEIEVEKSTGGIWFDHQSTRSAWTDGPVAGPLYYTEFFGATDLSYSGSLAKNQSENQSLGANVNWDVTDRLSLEFDIHNSTAESKPNSPYGSNMSLGTTVLGITEQSINFESDIPIISIVGNGNGLNPEDIANRQVSGSAFRNATMKDEITQTQINGSYDLDYSLIDSVKFGASILSNEVESRYGFLQTDSWGGLGSPADVPDDYFEWASLPEHFDGIPGPDDTDGLHAAAMQGFYRFDFAQMADLAESLYGVCSNPWVGDSINGSCLARQNQNRFIDENTYSAYIQGEKTFDLFGRDANVLAGLRYVETDVDGRAVLDKPVGTVWAADNELYYIYDGTPLLYSGGGGYDYLLPSIDVDFQPLENVKIRAAYNKTITRPTYDNLQPGFDLAVPFRVQLAEGSVGDPNLKPYESNNFDVSAEWYYGDDSYVSIGYYNKNVENFIGTTRITEPLDGLVNPASGPLVDEAVAALGANATGAAIRAYIAQNHPEVLDNGDSNRILGQLGDDQLFVLLSTPINSDQEAEFTGWEFALQHNFWDTGFGFIANYTISDSDFGFDNTQPFDVPQFAVPGLSDSANFIGFYDKNGIQVRAAYNWRDEFLSGNGANPFYTEEYGQWDVNASYEFDNGVSLFVEGINITEEERRGHRRHENNVFFYNPQKSRYNFGARYKF